MRRTEKGRDFPDMEFTLRGPDGRVVAQAMAISCCWCNGPVFLREGTDGSMEHLLVCPSAPEPVKRVARATDALRKAISAGPAIEEQAQELGHAIVDDIFDRGALKPEVLEVLTSDHLRSWLGMTFKDLPPPVRAFVDRAVSARLGQRKQRPA